MTDWGYLALLAAVAAGAAGIGYTVGESGPRAELADYKTEMTARVQVAQAEADKVRDEWTHSAAVVAGAYQKELTHVNETDADLKRRLAAGTVRVRIAGGCTDPVPNAASTASGADATAGGLTQGVQSSVLDLKRAIERDAAQITGLQAYVRGITGGGP